MEKFKAVEKEMKTKAFSKEGLSAAAKLDPKEKEKAEGCQFLSEMVEELERQVETLEAEEEGLAVTTKKGKKDTGKADRLAEIARLTEQHKWHQSRLELLLRALENGNVDIEQVNDVKDGIKYYVEENQSPEFVEDDSIYDDFNLDQEEATWGLANEIDRVSSQDTQSVADENLEPTEVPKAVAKQKSGSTSEPTGLSARRPSNQMGGKPALPALATLNNPLANTTNIPVSNIMKPAPPPARPPGETLKYASAAAAAASSDKASIAPLPPPPASTTTLAPLPPAPSKSASTSPNTMPSLPVAAQKTAIPTPAAPAAPTAPPSAQSPTTSHAASSSVPPTPALETLEPAGLSKLKSAQSLEVPREEQEQSPVEVEPETPPPPMTSHNQGQANGVKVEDQEESIFHLPECLSDLVEAFEETKNRPTDPSSQAVQRLLNISYDSCPNVFDVEKPRFYHPTSRYDIPSHYPTEPAPILDNPSLYERIDNDTLFFLFYYRQNTYQQHQAAKALKSQSWRFHKQYQTWFQRHEEPKTITEEYEQGTYRFFDYESTWLVYLFSYQNSCAEIVGALEGTSTGRSSLRYWP